MKYLLLLLGSLLLTATTAAAEDPPAGDEVARVWQTPELVWLDPSADRDADPEKQQRLGRLFSDGPYERVEVTRIIIDRDRRYVAAQFYRHAMNRPGTDWGAWAMVWDLKTGKRWAITNAYQVFDISPNGSVLASRYVRERRHRPTEQTLVLWHAADGTTELLDRKPVADDDPAVGKLESFGPPQAARFSGLGYIIAVQGEGHVVRYSIDPHTMQRTDKPPTVVDRLPWAKRDTVLLMPRQDVLLMSNLNRNARAVVYRKQPGQDRLVRRYVHGIAPEPDAETGKQERMDLLDLMQWLTETGGGEQVSVPAYWLEEMKPLGMHRTLRPMACANGQCMAIGEGAEIEVKHSAALDNPWRYKPGPDQTIPYRTTVFALSRNGGWLLAAHEPTQVHLLDAKTGEPIDVLPSTADTQEP